MTMFIKKQVDLFLNPKPFLEGLLGHLIGVKLKWGLVYEGELASYDKYFNIRVTLKAYEREGI